MKNLILLHGVGLNRQIWQPLCDALPEVTTHAYDLRGHGDGPDWVGDASLDGFVSDLWDYADQRDLESFALCGFSLGAMIAQWAALSKPARISHLVLLNGVYTRSPGQLAGVQARYKQAELHGPEIMIDAALARWFPAGFAANNPEYPAQVRACLLSNNTEQFMRSYKLFAYEGAQIYGRLSEIKVPTLVATGGMDAGSTPEMTLEMAAEISHAYSTVFNDAAHMLPMQKPIELAALIRDLLEKEAT